MNIVVPIKLVPDLVEELTVDESGAALAQEWLRLIISEFDDHAVEQAILLKESQGGRVTIVAPDLPDVEDTLYTAAAKGADRLLKLTGPFETGANNHALARVLAPLITDLRPDLVLTGVQTHADLDGSLGPLLATYLEMPYVGYVAGVTVSDNRAMVRKEYPGGLVAELELALPAVLGIQAATAPPRYVAFSKVRQAMKSATIEEQAVTALDSGGGPSVERLFEPEAGARAVMLEGDEEEIAARLVKLFQEVGLV